MPDRDPARWVRQTALTGFGAAGQDRLADARVVVVGAGGLGCALLPARYDQVVTALGGHGELVETIGDLVPAVERALASGKPACVNVRIESIAAPIIRKSA